MRLPILFGILVSFASSNGSAACECLWEGSFSEVQKNADLVLSGTISTRKGNSVDVTPQRILRGESPAQDVRIWLKAKDYCRPDAKNFPLGSQWVMALHEITDAVPGGFDPSTPNVSYGRIGDFSLSSCGGYWLALKESRVSGNLINAPRWVRDPKMTPVLIDLVAGYINGSVSRERLVLASEEDPALRELILDTRSFLRSSK